MCVVRDFSAVHIEDTLVVHTAAVCGTGRGLFIPADLSVVQIQHTGLAGHIFELSPDFDAAAHHIAGVGDLSDSALRPAVAEVQRRVAPDDDRGKAHPFNIGIILYDLLAVQTQIHFAGDRKGILQRYVILKVIVSLRENEHIVVSIIVKFTIWNLFMLNDPAVNQQFFITVAGQAVGKSHLGAVPILRPGRRWRGCGFLWVRR